MKMHTGADHWLQGAQDRAALRCRFYQPEMGGK